MSVVAGYLETVWFSLPKGQTASLTSSMPDKRVVCTSFLTMLTSFTSESCSSSDTDGTFITAVARKHMYTHCTLCTACHAAVGTLIMELSYIVHHIPSLDSTSDVFLHVNLKKLAVFPFAIFTNLSNPLSLAILRSTWRGSLLLTLPFIFI